VIGDHSMPHFSGTAALALVRGRGLDVPFICVSGTISEEMAVAAMRAGANDWVTKEHLKRLLPAIERELREAKGRAALRASEAGYETLVEHAPIGIYRSTPHGRFLSANQALIGMLGYASVADVLRLDMARDVYADPAEAQRVRARDSYTDLLLEDLGREDAKREDVEQIRKAADGAAALTRQLLAFSRQQVLEPRVVSLSAVVSGVEKMLRRVLGEDVDLGTVLDPDLG